MNKRDVLLALLALGAVPFTASGQLAVAPARIGVIFARQRNAKDMQAFFTELQRLGYEEGKNLTVDFLQGDVSKSRDSARELVRLKVDLIYAPSTAAAVAARTETASIPIVFATGHDPVEVGLVQSFAHPGGNVTGMAAFNAELAAKRLQLMKELIPNLARVAVLRSPLTKENIPGWHSVMAAAQTLGLALQPLVASTPIEFEGVFKAARSGNAQALLVLDDAFLSSQRSRIAPLAIEALLPSNSSWREGTEAGLLFSYGPNQADSMRKAAGYVAAILKGTKPADLPVQEPTQFELVINLKTAKTIGITIPQSLLLRADQVIE